MALSSCRARARCPWPEAETGPPDHSATGDEVPEPEVEDRLAIADLMTRWIHRDLSEWDLMRELFHDRDRALHLIHEHNTTDAMSPSA